MIKFIDQLIGEWEWTLFKYLTQYHISSKVNIIYHQNLTLIQKKLIFVINVDFLSIGKTNH